MMVQILAITTHNNTGFAIRDTACGWSTHAKVEKTITLGKRGTLHARRQAFKLIPAKNAVQKVFSTLADRYASRPGGYTRIIRTGYRKGDDAPMVFIELVDREGEAKPVSKAKTEANKETRAKKPVVTEKKKAEPKADLQPEGEIQFDCFSSVHAKN